MRQSNLRNFHYTQGKVAPLQPIAGQSMGNVNDQDRPQQWVNPYEFYLNNQFWHDPGRMFSAAAKDYYDRWLESLKGQKNVRPRTLTPAEFKALVDSLPKRS